MTGLSWIEGFGVEALTNGVKQGGPVRKSGPQKASTRLVRQARARQQNSDRSVPRADVV